MNEIEYPKKPKKHSPDGAWVSYFAIKSDYLEIKNHNLKNIIKELKNELERKNKLIDKIL